MSIINDQVESDMNQTLTKQPSVSAKKQGLIECADLVASIMNKDGISAMIVKRRTIL
jgi:hypothetical protein